MIVVQILFTFISGLWGRYASVDALLAAYNAAQVAPEPEEGQELQAPPELALTPAERALIERAIATGGLSYPIDLERMAAVHEGVKALKFYQGKADGVVIDGDTLVDQGRDLAEYDETIATENAWHKVAFIRQQMDAQILAQLDGLRWPGFLLLLKLYRVLHLHKRGEAFSLTSIAAAMAAEKAAKEAELAALKAAAKVAPSDDVVAEQ